MPAEEERLAGQAPQDVGVAVAAVEPTGGPAAQEPAAAAAVEEMAAATAEQEEAEQRSESPEGSGSEGFPEEEGGSTDAEERPPADEDEDAALAEARALWRARNVSWERPRPGQDQYVVMMDCIFREDWHDQELYQLYRDFAEARSDRERRRVAMQARLAGTASLRRPRSARGRRPIASWRPEDWRDEAQEEAAGRRELGVPGPDAARVAG